MESLIKLNGKKGIILQDPSVSFSHNIGESFKKRLSQEKIFSLKKQSYTTKLFSQNISIILENVVKEKPDFILFPSKSIENSSVLMKEITKRNMNIVILGSSSWHHPQLLSEGIAGSKGHYYFTNFSTKIKTKKVLAFIEQFKLQLKSLSQLERLPSTLAMMAYNSAMISLESYKKAQSTNNRYLTKALQNTDAPGLLGQISMSQERYLQSPGVIFKITPSGRKFFTTINF